jgi:serine/threonine protein kinase
MPISDNEKLKYLQKFDFETMSDDLFVKIADLGFAKEVKEDETTSTTCGTPSTIAPEVLL